MQNNETEEELTNIKYDLKSLKERFTLFTSIVLFVLTLQVVGSIYTSISVKDTTNEFIEIKKQQFNQIIANEKLDPKIKIESTDLLIAKVGVNPRRPSLNAVTFSVGIKNIGKTPASGLAIKVLLPKLFETEYQSFEDVKYEYEMLATPSRDNMFVPPDSIFRQLVVIPTTKNGVRNLKHESEIDIKILLYSKFGLEDERLVKLKINNMLMRSIAKS